MSHTISAIIVNYNAGRLLCSCVGSLLACPLDVDIIVVDNASHDASLNGLPASPKIRVIHNPTNMGFAAACNIGIQASSVPFFLFLNPDCCFEPGSVATLLAAFQSGQPTATNLIRLPESVAKHVRAAGRAIVAAKKDAVPA